MKRVSVLFAGLALVVGATMVSANEEKAASKSDAKAANATKTVTGEVIDTGCYLAHEARGEKHVGCATKCINGGMPMGILTSDGTLYLVTLNHDDADPYNQLKTMAGKTVSVTGTVMERSGMKGIDVTTVKLAAAAPAK